MAENAAERKITRPSITSLIRKIKSDEQCKERSIWKTLELTKELLSQCECGCNGSVKLCRDKKLTEVHRKIKEHIFFSNRKYAHRVSLLTMRNIPCFSIFDKEDALSCSDIGLLESIERYDVSRGVQFNTFSYTRIRGAVLDDIRRLNNFTAEIALMRRTLMPRIQIMIHILGRFPTLEDLSSTFSESEFKACLDPRFFSNIYNQSEDEIINKEESCMFNDSCRMTSEIRKSLGVDSKPRHINKVDIEGIVGNKFQANVIFYYYYMRMPISEISLVFGKSMSTISKAKTKAEDKIRDYFQTKSNMINFLYQ
jgi:RNA polymerase sigma factor FliA